MVRRTLGRTGIGVSPIGFGSFKIGRNQKIKYAQGYDLPSDAEADRLLNGVLDLGINLIDTAPAYGLAEQRIGQFIAHRRAEYGLSSKVGETFENGESHFDFSAGAVERSVHRSLQRLRTNVLDLLLIHSDGRDMQILQDGQAVAALQKLKQSGLVRFIGLSGKTVEGARAAMAWADVLMIEFHPADRSHASLIAEAGARGIGVLIKKPLAAGHIPAAEAIPFLLNRPEVGSLVIGGLNLQHMRENLLIAKSAAAMA